MIFEKDSVFTVKITDMTNEGVGVCRIDDTVVFVIGSVTEDVCEIKIIKAAKSYCVAVIVRLTEPSPYRVDPECAVKQCGGCVFQNISYEYELKLKKSFVETAFKKAGVDIQVEDVITAGGTSEYRNKAQFPVFEKDGKIGFGFFAKRTHRAVAFETCRINPEEFSKIAQTVCDIANERGVTAYDENTGKGILRHIYLRKGSEGIILTLVINGRSLPFTDEDYKAIADKHKRVTGIALNINRKNTNVITGEEYVTVYGETTVYDKLCGMIFAVSPASFYQVNHECCEALYNKAGELLDAKQNETVVDLYCGVGTVGLCVAKNAERLIGVEIVPKAIENAKQNARINGIGNAEFYCGDSSIVKNIVKDPDAVIVDPPRKGLSDDVIAAITELKPKKLLYISCNPDTLARDLKKLSSDYRFDTTYPFNMFPRTGHVECVTLMTKK